MLNEPFGLNNCEIRGDSWGGAVKREPRVVNQKSKLLCCFSFSGLISQRFQSNISRVILCAFNCGLLVN